MQGNRIHDKTRQAWRAARRSFSRIRVIGDHVRFGRTGVAPPAGLADVETWAREHGETIRLAEAETVLTPAAPVVGTDGAERPDTEGLVSTVPPQYAARIDKARIVGGAGSIVSPDNLLLADLPLAAAATRQELRRLLPGLPPDDAGRALAALRSRIMTRGPLPKPARYDACVAVLTTSFHDNYCHWTIDALPRLMLFEAAGLKPDLYFVPTGTAFQRESLALLGIDADRIIPATRQQHIEAREALVASEVRATATETVCDFLWARLLAPALERTQPSGRKRIYISRQKATWRRVTNEAEVIALLARNGFESVVLEAMSLAEQIRLLHDAEFVVGPHGAGLTNTVYCRPGTRVLEFTLPRHPIAWFQQIAAARGLRYVKLTAGEDSPAFRRGQEANMHVPLAALARGLEVLGVAG